MDIVQLRRGVLLDKALLTSIGGSSTILNVAKDSQFDPSHAKALTSKPSSPSFRVFLSCELAKPSVPAPNSSATVGSTAIRSGLVTDTRWRR